MVINVSKAAQLTLSALSGRPMITGGRGLKRVPLGLYRGNSLHSRRQLFHSTLRQQQHQQQHQQKTKRPLWGRLVESWNTTQVKWYPISLGLGFTVIGLIQYQRVIKREARQQQESNEHYVASGPWQVHVASALPLRTMSRLWGAFNSLTIPVFLRPFGYWLYGTLFGCNFDEMKNPDLTSYPNLSTFFYRELKEGVRPIAEATLVSPSDGKILHFGVVEDRRIEQVKGVTYSLDALLGEAHRRSSTSLLEPTTEHPTAAVVNEEEFANVNGIAYSLDSLLGTDPSAVQTPSAVGIDGLANNEAIPDKEARVLINEEILPAAQKTDTITLSSHKVQPGHALFFCVVYLAPGDYHRFHSPANWVVQTRRHFAGELYSVSPYFVNLLKNLFVLNERVVLLGKWKHGLFSMIPVGATNVGSIKINFDEALRTNRKEDLASGTYTEVSYKSASPLLGGKAERYGDEMGGFYLGSTVILVFEAPHNFKFNVTAGQSIKMGEALGDIETSA
ncbi:phosphatidylserine decarboxylase-domain-containing protein [Spinellus fusiger]|nr:phosphatidylserine decarboxylase-domain-containing protein [Spinellus fusiger]